MVKHKHAAPGRSPLVPAAGSARCFVMPMTRFAALLFALAALAPSAACAGQAPKAALWKLSDPDTTVYLFGTIHALPKALDWNTGPVKRTFGQADTLVVEVVGPEDAEKTLRPMLEMGMAEPGKVPPLAARVSQKTRGALKALVARSSFPPAALDRFETWLAALILAGPTISDAGLDPETGADRALMAAARARSMPIIGLETMEQQLGYFDSLPEKDQRALLDAVVQDDGHVKQEFHDLVAAWARGDVAMLEALADDELKASPHLREILLTRRNARWADWLARRMETPGTVFVAVGAGHLAGNDSVQKMLAAKGLKVERVQ